MGGLSWLSVIFIVGFLIWIGELIWLYREAVVEEEDWLPLVSGAAVFFVLAVPVTRAAPDLIDRLSDFWERVSQLDFMQRSRGAATPRLMIGGKSHMLNEERVRIGRFPNNDIVLDHPTVSAYHAEIVLRPDGRQELIDRDSRNGTRINGTPIRSAVLKDGDQITIGALSLHYLSRATSEHEAEARDLPAGRRRAG